MAGTDAQALIARIEEARSAQYVDESFAILCDIVEALNVDQTPSATAMLERARGRLEDGRRMKYYDNDYVEKVLPDLMLAYQFLGGRSEPVWERVRHMIWDERHTAALNEFTYLLELDLWRDQGA
jgi:hypothetical protein